ncbi:MAG: helix-turn-helix domain-containing protein [Synergistaceae bacterium]|nr:helix-turn-helix domain-containing protein [Synergistaceae bacterium]
MLIETEDYTDAATAAKILGVTRANISILCKGNRFPGQVKIGHFWAIPRDAVENFTRLKPGKKSSSRAQLNEVNNSE